MFSFEWFQWLLLFNISRSKVLSALINVLASAQLLENTGAVGSPVFILLLLQAQSPVEILGVAS